MSRYPSILERKLDTGKRYVAAPQYPDIPVSEADIVITSTFGDRYDKLAQSYYGDVNLWWIISLANPYPKDSLEVPADVEVRIPLEKDLILQNYIKLNKL